MITQVLALALSSTTSAVETPPPERQVVLEIDYAPLLEDQDPAAAEETVMFLREDGVSALQEVHGAEVVEEASAPAIVVELGWVNYSQSIYRITMYTRRSGEKARALESFECSCIDSGVIESVLARFPAALEQLGEAEVVVEERLEGEPAEVQAEWGGDEQPAGDSRAPSERKRRGSPIGALGIVGGVVAAGGLGVLGFGLSRLAKGEDRSVDLGDHEQGSVRDFRPQGVVWSTVGAVATVAGGVLLVVDLTVLRRRRSERLSVAPMVGPAWSGLTLRGSF